MYSHVFFCTCPEGVKSDGNICQVESRDIKVFSEDLKIAKQILNRNQLVTRDFFYRKSYPLFNSIFNNYYTDCDSCLEFINEIYIHILTPGPKTRRCQLENFRGESTLTSWLKTVCLFYCFEHFKKKERLPREENIDAPGISGQNGGSIDLDDTNLSRRDVETLLDLMPNQRYSRLIRLKYLEQMTHEETAIAMGMTMPNYYNKHLLAKKQYDEVRKKEGKYE